MAKRSTTRLLLINGSDNETEALISLFRNAGHVARAQRVGSAEELDGHLAKPHEWDLVIVNDHHPELQPPATLKALQERCPELPVIAISDADPAPLFAGGARDVIGSEDHPRLIHAALREIAGRRLQRRLDATIRQLEEAEQRSALLLSESSDAIAYISDGMVINANTLFAQRFGFADSDDLDCMPIVDLIAERDHDRLKAMLKAQQDSDQENQLDFTGLAGGAAEFQAMMLLSSASYEGESCVQLLVRDEAAVNAPVSGDDSHAQTSSFFLQQLTSAARQASSGATGSALLYIGINDFVAQRRRLGLSGWRALMADLVAFSADILGEGHHTAACGDDAIGALLRDASPEQALATAEMLAQKIEEHIVELNGQSIQVTVAIGVVPLDAQTGDDPDRLLDCGYTCAEALREDATSGAALYTPAREKRTLSLGGDINKALDDALEDQRFVLVFQPIISLRGASGEHYEVRLRMRDENGEESVPTQLLQELARDPGNTRLDRWVILEATKLLAAHRAKDNDTRLFINLTPNAMQDDTLLPWLAVALKAAGLPADALILQFTEDDLVSYLKPARQFGKGLRDLGCRLAINRFGRGQDPAKLLKQLTVDFAKIDGSFTAECLQPGGDAARLKALVAAIAEHSVKAIISHVENAAAMATLWQFGVDYIQGNYLQAPVHEMSYEFTDIA